MLHREYSTRDVGNHHRDCKRRNPARTLGQKRSVIGLQYTQTTNAAAEHDTNAITIHFGFQKPGISQGHLCGRDTKMRIAVHAAGILGIGKKRLWIKATNFTTDLHGIIRGIHVFQETDSAATSLHSLPG